MELYRCSGTWVHVMCQTYIRSVNVTGGICSELEENIWIEALAWQQGEIVRWRVRAIRSTWPHTFQVRSHRNFRWISAKFLTRCRPIRCQNDEIFSGIFFDEVFLCTGRGRSRQISEESAADNAREELRYNDSRMAMHFGRYKTG